MTETPSSSTVFAAFDGGGSTTRALIASEDGKILAIGRSGPSNPNIVGTQAAARALQDAWSAAWVSVQLEARAISAAYFGVAGAALWQLDGEAEELLGWLPRVSSATLQLDHDLSIALAGGLSGRPGIALIAGTGSAGFARNDAQQTARCGGGGALLDDAGSGYWLGLAALRETHRVLDARNEPSGLSQAIVEATGARDAASLLGWIHHTPTVEQRAKIAALARIVLQQARQGDMTARRFRDAGADELALIAVTLAKKLFPRTTPEITISGGLSQDSEYVETVQLAVMDHLGSDVKIARPEHTPLVGALILAFASLGKTVPADVLSRADALPGAS
ncbi:MAG TPA: BadF/BadG/BcrA/BcrD ATPase family protein [Opitutaceae bacterium]|nr:BadF/BadG/BcrA/BcrD ATPase family protein [Opitutaceae bacterium]